MLIFHVIGGCVWVCMGVYGYVWLGRFVLYISVRDMRLEPSIEMCLLVAGISVYQPISRHL